MGTPLVSHIGIVVADLQQAIEKYTALTGKPPDLVKELPEMAVTVAVFEGAHPAGGHVELLAPQPGDNSIARFLKRHGEGLHHICLHVDDIEAKLAELKSLGYRLIDETVRTGAMGHKIAFVHPSSASGVLIELEESAGKS